MNGWYFVLGLITYQILKMLVLAIRQEIQEYKERKFIKCVRLEFPDAATVTFISADTSSKEAMAQLEEELHAYARK